MKKLITLLLVLTGAVCTASAQRETAGYIRVAFTEETGTNHWTQSKFYICVNDQDEWPGVDVTDNTEEIDGKTYYYRDIDISTYGTSYNVQAVNRDANGDSQSESAQWAINGGDRYFGLKDNWDNGKRLADMQVMYYVASTDGSIVKKASQSGTTYSATFSADACTNFIIANTYAFTSTGVLNWDSEKNNMYRRNYDKNLSFENLTLSASDSEFARHQGNGSWVTSGINGTTIDMTFVISNYNPVSYTLSPSFTRTLNANAEGYGTFSSEYDVLIPSGLTAQYASDVNATTGAITWENYPATGIKAEQGALLTGTAGQEYTFTPASSAVAPDANYLKAIGSDYAETALPQDDGTNTNFILSKVSNHIGFYKVATGGSWVNVGTAYLQVPGTNLSRSFFMFDEDATAVEAVKQEQKLNGEFFNLAGQRVAQPTKGLYIVNGKKVIMK